jgi:hypothetical protein
VHPAGSEALVELLLALHGPVDSEGTDAFSARSGRRAPESGIAKVGQSGGQGGRITGRHQPPFSLVRDDSGDTPDLGGHDRQPSGHRLQQGDRESLEPGR